MDRRKLLAGVLLIGVGAAFVVRLNQAPFEKHIALKPFPTRVVDQVGLLPRGDVGKMNAYLQHMYQSFGVDMRFLLVDSVGGESLENFAVDQARAQGVGANSGEKGVLCVYEAADQRMRIEVGPKLEGVLTDAFVSYLERENTHAYVSAKDLSLGLNLTFQLIMRRLQQAELGEAYDPRPGERILDGKLLAEGAGATEAVGAQGAGSALINRAGPPDILEKYSPQPTVEQAWAAYQSWEVEPYEYVDASLLTPETREFLKREPMSRAYFDFIIMNEYGQPHVVEQDGEVAMIVFTHSPFISPYYFRHTPQGWQMDIVGSIRNSRELIGNIYTWEWRDGHDEYSRAFADQVVMLNNIPRIAGSDNRPLPMAVQVAP